MNLMWICTTHTYLSCQMWLCGRPNSKTMCPGNDTTMEAAWRGIILGPYGLRISVPTCVPQGRYAAGGVALITSTKPLFSNKNLSRWRCSLLLCCNYFRTWHTHTNNIIYYIVHFDLFICTHSLQKPFESSNSKNRADSLILRTLRAPMSCSWVQHVNGLASTCTAQKNKIRSCGETNLFWNRFFTVCHTFVFYPSGSDLCKAERPTGLSNVWPRNAEAWLSAELSWQAESSGR